MTDVLRTFIGLRYQAPSSVLQLLDELNQADPNLRVVPDRNLHVTLKFLGPTPECYLPGARRALDGIAEVIPPFSVQVQGLGAFPRPSRPSVLWLGLKSMVTPDPLVMLAEMVESELTRIGFAAEERTFQPHLTVARVKSRPTAQLIALMQQHARTGFGSWPIQTIELIQSTLQPQGAIYTMLHESRLSDGDGLS